MLNKVKYIYRLLTAASASRNCRLWQEKKMRWRLSMWQNILVWFFWICSMWYLGSYCKIICWKLTVAFVIRKAVPNSHACNTQWLADQLHWIFWLTLQFSEHHGEAVPICCSSSSWQHRLLTNCIAASVSCSLLLPSTVCLSLLDRSIHSTSLQSHSLYVLCGLARKVG